MLRLAPDCVVRLIHKMFVTFSVQLLGHVAVAGNDAPGTSGLTSKAVHMNIIMWLGFHSLRKEVHHIIKFM